MRKTLYAKEYRHLVRLLRDLRSDAGITQAELARRLKRHQSFVSKYEAGERRLDVVELIHVCHALGVRPTAFMTKLERAL